MNRDQVRETHAQLAARGQVLEAAARGALSGVPSLRVEKVELLKRACFECPELGTECPACVRDESLAYYHRQPMLAVFVVEAGDGEEVPHAV